MCGTAISAHWLLEWESWEMTRVRYAELSIEELNGYSLCTCTKEIGGKRPISLVRSVLCVVFPMMYPDEFYVSSGIKIRHDADPRTMRIGIH